METKDLKQSNMKGRFNMFEEYSKLSIYDYSKRSQASNNTLEVLDFVDYNKIYGIPVIQHDKHLIAF